MQRVVLRHIYAEVSDGLCSKNMYSKVDIGKEVLRTWIEIRNCILATG